MAYVSGKGGYEIGQAQDLLGQARGAGLFDPFGSPRIRALMRQRAMQLFGAGQQNAQGLSRLYGLDPYQQRAALAGQGLMGTGQLTGALNNAEYTGATSNIPFYQNLYNSNLNFARQQNLQQQQQKAAQQGAFGSILGQGIGMLVPGAGKLFGGGQQQQNPYENFDWGATSGAF
jgi:hypothetical protein